MNLLYYTNFVLKLDYLHSTLNNPTPSFIADDETKLFQTQLATTARLEEVTVNWVIILSSCIVGRFWVRHRLSFIGYEFARVLVTSLHEFVVSSCILGRF